MAINIYTYTSYQEFIKDFIHEKIQARGLSFRYFSKRCKFSSPNFFQQLIARKRFLSALSASKVAKGFDLTTHETHYFMELVAYEKAKSLAEQTKRIENLTRIAKIGLAVSVTDQSFHASWLHSVVWELASVKNFECTIPNLVKRLGHVASELELKKALDYLLRNGFLTQTSRPHCYEQANVNPSAASDIDNLLVRLKHQKFLELAGQSLNLPILEREFQGLTIAVSPMRLKEAKAKIRQFVQALNSELSNDANAQTVARLQVCLYPITRD